MKIIDMQKEDKPRERLIKYGALNLSNEDLISILLSSGTKDMNVKQLSLKLLSEIGGINNLKDISLSKLMKIKGIKTAKGATILAAIELGKRVINNDAEPGVVINTPDKIHKYFSHKLLGKAQEEILIVLLDNKKRLIDYKIMYRGTSTSSVISVKEIMYYAITEGADAIVMMHNHPSGILNPSKEDIEITNSLISSGKMMGIPLIDHLITNGREYYSFFDENQKKS